MELKSRVKSQDEARAVVDSPVFSFIEELLGSPDTEVSGPTGWMLGELARHETTAMATVGLLVSLLRQVSIMWS
jgi:3-methyladenine DNA glycosylase AlkD